MLQSPWLAIKVHQLIMFWFQLSIFMKHTQCSCSKSFEKWITNQWMNNKQAKKLNKLKWINFRMCMLLIISLTKIKHDEYQWCMDSSGWKTNDWRRRWKKERRNKKKVIIDFLFCVTMYVLNFFLCLIPCPQNLFE